MPFSPCVLSSKAYSTVAVWRDANVKLLTERRDYQIQGAFQITGVGTPREAVSPSCISDFHVEVACLWHWPQMHGDPRLWLFLLTHTFWSIGAIYFTAQSPLVL